MTKVWVTGMGMVTAAGSNVTTCGQTLMRGGVSFAPSRYVKTTLSVPVAEVPFPNSQLADMCGLTYSPSVSRTFYLGLLAAREALAMAGIADASSLGLIAASTGVGIDINEQYYALFAPGAHPDVPEQVCENFSADYLTRQLAHHFGITQPVTCISTACSSGANALMLAARLIQSGKAKRLLVGGMDSLSRFQLNGFNSLEIVSPDGCHPFSASRNGVTLGEGAAFLVLEADSCVGNRPAYACLSGYANCNEAYHQTATQPDGLGAAAVIRAALRKADLLPQQISYVQAHGTGTVSNDLSEGLALQKVLGSRVPVSSVKGFTGHTLAACGAVGAVCSVLALQQQCVFRNAGQQEAMPEAQLALVQQSAPAVVQHVLTNSFGFGGNDVSLIFSKI